MRSQLICRDVAAGLTKNSFAGAGVEVRVIGYGQGLLLSGFGDASQLDVTAPLREYGKPELTEDFDNIPTDR